MSHSWGITKVFSMPYSELLDTKTVRSKMSDRLGKRERSHATGRQVGAHNVDSDVLKHCCRFFLPNQPHELIFI